MPQPPALKVHRFPRRAIRTFLVEDSPLLMTLVARVISRDERVFIVGAAADGRKAVSSSRSLHPDLVITDLHLPGMDGAEATRLFKQRPPTPVVIVVTSDDSPEVRARCLAAGADAFLFKSAGLASQLLSTICDFFPNDPKKPHGQTRQRYETLTTVE